MKFISIFPSRLLLAGALAAAAFLWPSPAKAANVQNCCAPGCWTLQGSKLNVNGAFMPHWTTILGVNGIQLTDDGGNNESGAAWNGNLMDLTQPFDYSFLTYFGYDVNGPHINSGDRGADGIVFVLQNDSRGTGALGWSDEGLGIATSGPVTGIFPSVSVEVDSWQNSYDPAYDHISIDENGNQMHSGCPSTTWSATGFCPVQANAVNTNIKDLYQGHRGLYRDQQRALGLHRLHGR
jgi:hypothetical protein